jgi:hypothetical protein
MCIQHSQASKATRLHSVSYTVCMPFAPFVCNFPRQQKQDPMRALPPLRLVLNRGRARAWGGGPPPAAHPSRPPLGSQGVPRLRLGERGVQPDKAARQRRGWLGLAFNVLATPVKSSGAEGNIITTLLPYLHEICPFSPRPSAPTGFVYDLQLHLSFCARRSLLCGSCRAPDSRRASACPGRNTLTGKNGGG